MLGGLLSELCRKYKRTAVFIATAISILLTMALAKAIYCNACELSLITIVFG